MTTPKLKCCKLGLPRREANQSMPGNCDTGQNSDSDERAIPWFSAYFYFLPDIFGRFPPRIHVEIQLIHWVGQVSHCEERSRNTITIFTTARRMPTQEKVRVDRRNLSDILVFAEYYVIITKSAQYNRRSCYVCRGARCFLLFFFRNGLCKEQ